MTELLHDGPRRSELRLILAHGAGAGMESGFMRDFAAAMGERGVHVVRFEFPYMQKRKTGLRSPPDRPDVLMQTWRDVVKRVGKPDRTFIGGKSMGGRIASMVADELGVRGLICLGYPFHPPEQPEKLRTAHLADLRTRSLIVQGTRDTFGTQEEIAGYQLSKAIELVFLADGDHSFVPRKASGHTRKTHFQAALDASERFLRARNSSPQGRGGRLGPVSR
ncbi:MAG TPA: alpha/beta fold hydrolase [Polyangiales bacterium]|nr:alpha/beta fold hydrolase [Polyangiales bacterium]